MTAHFSFSLQMSQCNTRSASLSMVFSVLSALIAQLSVVRIRHTDTTNAAVSHEAFVF
jgi:hypothetical protein